MAKEDQIARWMYAEVESRGRLGRKEATSEIAELFGSEWTCPTPQGGRALDRRVLKAFDKLTGTKVVFVSNWMYWRLRRPADEPGRKQTDDFPW